MKYSILFAGILLFISTTVFSQSERYLYYFDKDLHFTEKIKSVYNGTGIIENGLLEFKMYDAINDKLLVIAHYTDSTLQISEGLLQSYYDNGLLIKEVNYVQGKINGLSKQWDTLGHIIDSSVYNDGEKVMETHTGYHENGLLDSFVVNNMKNDVLRKTYYDDKGKTIKEINFTGQNGTVKYYDSTGNERIDKVFTRAEIEASFPGGERGWTRYIMTQIEQHIDELTSDGKSGTCRVKFIVDAEGKVKNVEALTLQNTALAKVAVNAVKKGPKWIPATQYGRSVNAFGEQPVSFRLQGN